MSETIFGNSIPVRLRCGQCGETRTDCVAVDEGTTRVTGVTFLCVPCLRKNERLLLDKIMSEGDPWKEESCD